jgi:hypothetical protein
MQPTLQLITEAITQLNHPITQHRLRAEHDIEDIYYQSDKLIIHFTFPHVQSTPCRTFQRAVLKILKQDLRISHVQLNYTQETTAFTQAPASPSKKLFPTASFIVLTPKTNTTDTTQTACNIARHYVDAGNVVALIDFALTSRYVLTHVQAMQYMHNQKAEKLEPFMLDNEIALMSTYLLNPHNRPMTWRDDMLTRTITQYIADVAWPKETSIFLFHLPAQFNHLLPQLMNLIPELKVEVFTDERS